MLIFVESETILGLTIITDSMARHNKLGKSGEEYAAEYLTSRGYVVRDCNWRSGKLELDLVAVKDNCLVIVEVKTRRNADFAFPEEAVTESKIRHLVKAADAYVRQFDLPFDVRFDVLALVGEEPPFVIEHIEEAFVPPLNV